MLAKGHLRMWSTKGGLPRTPCPRASSRRYRTGVAIGDERHHSGDPAARGTRGVARQQDNSAKQYPSSAPKSCNNPLGTVISQLIVSETCGWGQPEDSRLREGHEF